MDAKRYWFWLVNVSGLGSARIRKLLSVFQCPEGIYQAKQTEILKIPGFGHKITDAIIKSRNPERIEIAYAKLEKRGIYFVSKMDADYPQKLLNFEDAPYGLYYKGRLPSEEKKSIAIVGARECSIYGREIAIMFARELSKAGIQIISGMARGIDSYAQQGAVEEAGSTWAVLGSGIDVCYPPENQRLYDKIAAKGGILSEYGLGIPAFAGNFPMRNRIISGLCDGILVVEAKERSGSLITADIALEQGKDIFAVPGRIGDIRSYGCNRLIKMGANLVQEPKDILQNYHFYDAGKCKDSKKNNNMLETREKIVYANLSYQPKHINELLEETELGLLELLECLLALETKGYIKQIVKNFYILETNVSANE